MKKLLFAFLACSLYFACYAQSTYLSNGSVFNLNKEAYNSLHPAIRDSLHAGIKKINDYHSLYTSAEKAVLDSLIQAFQNKTGFQVTLLTFDSSMVEGYTVEEVVRTIGIQHKNAITIGIAPSQRSLYIWNDSLVNNTVLNELETKAAIDNYFVPHFAKGAYYEGTVSGVKEIFNTILRKRSFQKVGRKNNG